MRRQATIAFLCLSGVLSIVSSVRAEDRSQQPTKNVWLPIRKVDRLTGETTVTFVARETKSTFVQFGHRVRTTLYMACTDGEVVNAVFSFSESIGLGEVLMRIRFDNGAVYHTWTEVRDHGNLWWLSLGYREPDNEKVDLKRLLLASSRVRVELSGLSWAKTAVLEFDTSGAAETASKLNCGSRK